MKQFLKTMRPAAVGIAASILLTCSLTAELRLPALFTDHMVLQRDQVNKVWGWDEPGTAVRIEFGGKSYSAAAGEDGAWSLLLDAAPANAEPQVMRIEGSGQLEIRDILIGEVWLCSGQSNMQWPLDKDWTGDLNILAADLPGLRLISVPKVGTQELQDDFDGAWSLSTPETAAGFSAVGFYFGRYLHEILDVPVGLIDNAWGGSAAEAWVRRDALEGDPRFAREVDSAKETDAWMQSPEAHDQYLQDLEAWETGGKRGRKPRSPEQWFTGQHRAGNLFAGVLYPIIGYGIKGVIWYQGEANSSRAYQYRELFPFMIGHWRAEWGQGDFPFYWVQLADFRDEEDQPGESAWAELRAAQTSTLALLNTGQAVIIDLGEGRDIHPRKKYEVASRLVRWALVKDYGYDLPYRSPEFAGMTIEGGTVAIDFETFGSQLKTYDKQEVLGFAICGADRVWHWADAQVIDEDTVAVSSEAVPEPVAVRYAWADNPVCNLMSAEGLPVTPFRTDDFPWTTEPSSVDSE